MQLLLRSLPPSPGRCLRIAAVSDTVAIKRRVIDAAQLPFGSATANSDPVVMTTADIMNTSVNEPRQSAIKPPICGDDTWATPKVNVAAA